MSENVKNLKRKNDSIVKNDVQEESDEDYESQVSKFI